MHKLILLAILFSFNARAETGYVFESDINNDGVMDSIVSGPSELFGNAGGPFIISLSNGKDGFIKKVLGLHPSAVAIDVANGHPRIWTYWRSSCCFGSLVVTTLGKQFKEEHIDLYFGESWDSPTVSRDIYHAIFQGKYAIKFKTVENYSVPKSINGEW